MANISSYLAAIMSAIYGRDVRSSIHDAIREINIAQEQCLNAGTAISSGDPAGGVYADSLYFNTSSNDLLQCDGTTWNVIDNLEGNAITSITGPTPDPLNPLIDVYTINFSKIPSRTFTVNNGRGIASISGPTVDPSHPLVDNYLITFNDGSTMPYIVTNGKGIDSIVKTSSAGLTDTYTITYNDGSTDPLIITNGKDGCTWLHGIEISGKAPASTGYTLLNDKCQAGDMYFNIVEGAVYGCDVGADKGARSYWSCLFVISGGGGGVSYLYLLNDVDTASVQTPTNGQILQFNGSTGFWEAKDGGSGHTMKPVPSTHPTEADVVSAINTGGLDDTNNEVASLYGISKWSNSKTFRAVLKGDTGAIGHYGVGDWKWTLDNPSSVDEANWGWWQNDIFKLLGNTDLEGFDIDLKLKFDTSTGEPITLGGRIIDKDTGYMCIRFANYVQDVVNAKIIADVTITRNDIDYVANP